MRANRPESGAQPRNHLPIESAIRMIQDMQAVFDFTGYRVLVAGGSKGIGRAMARAFARAGAGVSVCARGEQALASVSSELRSDGASAVHSQSCDLADATQINAWIEAAAAALGGIDVLINNATGYGFDGRDDEHWLADFQIDLLAAVRASRAAEPFLQESKHASILHTSSISALGPRPEGPPYAAMKAALNHYTGTQALTLAKKRIRVNAIAPGSIEFEGGIWDHVRQHEPERYRKVLDAIPFARYGSPDDVADVALLLASPLARWVTGQIIAVDGDQALSG